MKNLLDMEFVKTPQIGTTYCSICGELIDEVDCVRMSLSNVLDIRVHFKCLENMYKVILLRKV